MSVSYVVISPTYNELSMYSAPKHLDTLQSVLISALPAFALPSTVSSGLMLKLAFHSIVSSAFASVMGSDDSQIAMIIVEIGSSHTSEMNLQYGVNNLCTNRKTSWEFPMKI